MGWLVLAPGCAVAGALMALLGAGALADVGTRHKFLVPGPSEILWLQAFRWGWIVVGCGLASSGLLATFLAPRLVLFPRGRRLLWTAGLSYLLSGIALVLVYGSRRGPAALHLSLAAVLAGCSGALTLLALSRHAAWVWAEERQERWSLLFPAGAAVPLIMAGLAFDPIDMWGYAEFADRLRIAGCGLVVAGMGHALVPRIVAPNLPRWQQRYAREL